MKSVSALLAASCLLSAASAQYWTGPYPLTSSSFQDINPSACKEFLPGDMTCLVWQSLTTEAWNIGSRFGQLSNGNGWFDIQWVTHDSAVDNVNPAVACLNDWQDHPSYWCVWEQRESPLVGNIMASFITFRDSWGPPETLGRTIHTDGDSAMPGIITIEGQTRDTVWVAWRNHDTGGTYVNCVYHDGDSWSLPQVAAYRDLRHARVGRSNIGDRQRPLLVWEETGDIWYSLHDSTGWSTPAQVAPSAYEDRDPDVVSSDGYFGCGTYVVWQSMRDGDTAIYITGDSFSVAQRVSNISGAGRNWTPAAANVAFTTQDYWDCIGAWVSDRNGNPDIYSTWWTPWDYYVDLDSADDLSPVVTSMGDWASQMVWVLWQSNRNGNWDIYGSFMYNSGIHERAKGEWRKANGGPTILSGASGLKRLASSVLFDAMGRRVVEPKPGVYFVREQTALGSQHSGWSAVGGERSAVRVRKVIVQR